MCAGQDKTPGETWAGAHGTAGLSWGIDQGGSMTPVSVAVEGAACSLAGAVEPASPAAMEVVVEVGGEGVQLQAGTQTEAA